jgi:hypothetical protein
LSRKKLYSATASFVAFGVTSVVLILNWLAGGGGGGGGITTGVASLVSFLQDEKPTAVIIRSNTIPNFICTLFLFFSIAINENDMDEILRIYVLTIQALLTAQNKLRK